MPNLIFNIFNKYWKIIPVGILMLLIVVLFIPLTPIMPVSGLDNSWTLGMNAAIGNNLQIGRDIVFTFGPYASIVTKMYSPDTDSLMIYGGLVIGLGYCLALAVLLRGVSLIWLVLLYVVISGVNYFSDPVLFSYPLLITLIVYRMALPDNNSFSIKNNQYLLALLFIPFGLLSLIKGSFFIEVVFFSLLISLFFKFRNNKLMSIFVLLIPLVSVLIFWFVAGQPLSGIGFYFLNLIPIISGYTDAMSVSGEKKEIVLYILASIFILYILATLNSIQFVPKLFLMLSYSFVLFIMFKGGFVRHDAHAIMPATGIIIVAVLLCFTCNHRLVPVAVIISFIVWGVIDKNYYQTSTGSIYSNIANNYKNARDGIKNRFRKPDKYQKEYDNGFENIANQYKVPDLEGSVDIYSYNQAYLLASNNEWNPRPVFQSYSVYKPSLSFMNRDHLLGDKAPDNIIFSVQPIDNRFPPLEDGASWPAILNNYYLVEMDEKFIYLKKKKQVSSEVTLTEIIKKEIQFGEELNIPHSSGVLFAKIHVTPTFFGIMKGVIFKKQQLKIIVTKFNGISVSYRLIPSMSEAGFVLSPVIENNRDFSFLISNRDFLKGNIVKFFKIETIGDAGLDWSKNITITIQKFEINSKNKDFNLSVFDERVKTLPFSYEELTSEVCTGNLERVNGNGKGGTDSFNTLSVEGWIVESVEKNLVPEMVYVTLTDSQGDKSYIKSNFSFRPDINQYFSKLTLPDAGYKIFTDVRKLSGKYTIGVSKYSKGKLVDCDNFRFPVMINN